MNKRELLDVVKELYEVIGKKKLSPNDAKSVAGIFLRSVNDNAEKGVQEYLRTGTFRGNPPEI